KIWTAIFLGYTCYRGRLYFPGSGAADDQDVFHDSVVHILHIELLLITSIKPVWSQKDIAHLLSNIMMVISSRKINCKDMIVYESSQ
ncbi:hypothetical protein, partial [Duncaniella muris]|uniref:hypothetical protein n=1 Tax=Duncaniella muris TaxID=2094150 RepID=UPI00272EE6FA